jgi:hypothetical protein
VSDYITTIIFCVTIVAQGCSIFVTVSFTS